MPRKMQHGQGQTTAAKERAFHGIFTMNFAVARQGYVYHHFDLNAGCGYNHLVGCDGSPLVFLQAVRSNAIGHYAAHFVDNDPAAVKELLNRLEDTHCTVYDGDNREFVYAIPSLIRLHPGRYVGTVLCDPNGTDIPWNELAWLAQQCPYLDFVLNYSARQYKRDRGAGYKPEIYLPEHLSNLHKRHWHIQEPLPDDRQEWMILVGRNYAMADWSAMRLYALESPRGYEALRKTFSRYEQTLSLFGL